MVFGYREISYSMGLNDFFGPRQKYIPYATPNNGPVNLSLELIITDIHIVLRKNYFTSNKKKEKQVKK